MTETGNLGAARGKCLLGRKKAGGERVVKRGNYVKREERELIRSRLRARFSREKGPSQIEQNQGGASSAGAGRKGRIEYGVEKPVFADVTQQNTVPGEGRGYLQTKGGKTSGMEAQEIGVIRLEGSGRKWRLHRGQEGGGGKKRSEQAQAWRTAAR